MRKLLIFLWVFISVLSVSAQKSLSDTEFIGNIVEEFLEANDDESFDYNTVFENLYYYYEHPLNINNVTEFELRDLIILNEIQINDFFYHKQYFGDYLDIRELQVLPSWDLNTIRSLVPFLYCDVPSSSERLNLKEALTKGGSQLYIKAKRLLEERKGFIKNDEGVAPYAGDPNHVYVRYRYEYGQLFKAGITMEKDPGEKFFGDGSPYGFDFYSFFLYAKGVSKRISAVTLGDFAVSLGQGLILYNDFATGKSSYVMNIKKGGRTLRPYSSVNETNFFRGGGAIFNLGKNWEAAAFASYKPTDATVARDTIENTDFDSFGSIRTDGYHRTMTEINNKNTIQQTNFGGKIQYKIRNFQISGNLLYTGFNTPLIRDDALYRKYQFNGDQLTNGSIDYSWRRRNMTFFGEVAMSDNGSMANIHGVLVGLDPKMDFSMVYRNFSPEYQVLDANAFAESSLPVNERGFYLGMEFRPHKQLTVSTYADFWKNPWVSFRRDAPGDGKEYQIKVAYTQKRKMDLYVQYRYKTKQYNNSETAIRQPIYQTLQRLRLHFGYKINSVWEIRDRIEFSKFDKIESSRGYMVYQDVLYKPIGKKISFTARYGLFDVNSFDARIYTYESDILYEYYIPFFQNRGSRFNINTRYRINRAITWEFRFGRTYYENVDGISSGNSFINGNTQTELKTQFRIKF